MKLLTIVWPGGARTTTSLPVQATIPLLEEGAGDDSGKTLSGQGGDDTIGVADGVPWT